MEKRNITLWGLVLLGCLFGAQAFAQTNVNMPNNTGQQNFTVNPAGAFFNFYDTGGPAVNYPNNQNPATSAVSFAPSFNPNNKIRVNFTSHATEGSFDALYIRDGALATSPLFASANGAPLQGGLAGGWWGTALTGQTFTAGPGNASGALHFSFVSDGSGTQAGWVATITEIFLPPCLIAPANITTGTSLTTCDATVNVPLPGQNTPGCSTNAGFFLRYQVNGGAFVNIAQPYPASVAIGPLPTGTHVITWQLLDAAGAIQHAVNHTVTVIDNVPPTITCPQSVTINLGPGECSKIYTYNVLTTDNCPVTANGSISNPIGAQTNTGQAGHMFTVENKQPFPITLSSFDFYFRPGLATYTMEVWVTTTATTHVGNQANAGAWTKVGPNFNLNQPFVLTQTRNVPAVGGIVIPANSSRGIYVTSQQFFAGSPMVAQQNPPAGFIEDANLRVDRSTGNLVNYPFGVPNVFPGFIFYGNVNYQYAVDPLTQLAGLPSGAEFPIGTTTNVWKSTDLVGNMATCSFNVTVLEYPNPIASLVCNDLVQVSLDQNCTAVVGADQVLEGGPYGCYDDYIVELDKTLPYGNGPWVPAVLGPGDVGKTYQVRVTDPETGNKCWGNLKVEDKLAPVLVCENAAIPCNADATPGLPPLPISASISKNFAINDATNTVVTIDVPGNVGTINDLNIVFRTNHTWIGDINGKIKSPAGTEITFFNYPGNGGNCGGCANDGMDVFFDDAAAATHAQFIATCNGTVPAVAGAFQPAAPLAAFNGQKAAGTWTLTFNDGCGGDFGPVSFAALQFQALSNPVPFPNQLVSNVNVFQNGNACYTVTAGTGTPVLEPCSDASLCYLDTEIPQDCASGLTKIVNRKWTATDASGNTATCIQVISFIRPTIADVVAPPNYDDIDEPAFECNSTYPTPDYIEGVGLQGYPYVYGEPDGCSIGWTYEDHRIDVCQGTYKILRKWFLVDWCTGDDVEVNQVIKVLDDQGPVFNCPANITVGTDPFTCCSTTDLPDAIIEDACGSIVSIGAMIQVFDPQTNQQIAMHQVGGSLQNFPGNNLWDLDTLGNFGSTPCLPLGSHLVTYMAEDACGNTSTCTFRIIVRDFTPPVAACDEFTVVGIGVDDPFDCYGPAGPVGQGPAALDACSFAGVTWVKAKTFDDGSYDNCGDIRLTIQRMQPFSDCINGLNFFNGHPACDDVFPDFPSEFERAGTEGDSIKFYCCEVGTTQTVILRVYQLDANGNITVGPDGSPVQNQCMIQVEVQDKIKPICTSPANVTVSCENFDPSLWAYGKPTVVDNCCLDTAQVYQGQCGLSHTASYTLFDTVCNKGTITRTFRAFDCHGLQGTCTQRIVVNYEQDYFVKFPNDVIVTVCDGTGNYGEPTFFGEDCELLGVSHEDEIFTVVPDACFKIERTWTIINWCTYNPNSGCIEVPNPNPNAILNNPANLTGPTVSAAGTPAPWNPTVIAIAPGQTPTNYSTFWNANANCYKYKQIIKVIDTQAPVVTCPPSPVEICDLTPNNSQLWNEMYWYDSKINSHDLCEAPTDLCITGTDLCSGANINIRYILFLDLDGDGTMETVISSTNLPGFNNVQFGNGNNPNFSGGTPRAFDERPVPSNQKYGFAIQTTTSGTNTTACVRWNTQQSPNTYVVPELPYGTHKIKWVLNDGCGNESICEYTFVVKDCKAPTVVCINGLSVNIMPTKMVVLWDTDFLQYTEDNCTPSGQLVTAIRRSGTGTGFPLNPDGTPQKSVAFTCDDVGTQLVELWSIDKAGNADYCETYVIIQDNGGFCNNNNGTVAGTLKTEAQNGLEDANVDINGSHPSLPPVTMFTTSDNQGNYELNGIPFLGNYTVTPMKDNDPLNGVSTFDLVLINKHILGLEPLSTPYKMIAADANNSRSLTTFDIVELRKLILGIYTELPNNTSWRFVDKSFSFPNQNNPFQTIFPETKQIADMQASMMNEHFVSVKVGDVNGNAVASSLTTTEDRTAGTLLFDVEDRAVKAGETFTVNFKAAEKVQGYQFTMNYTNLDVVEVVPGTNMTTGNFGVFSTDHALTTSWDGDTQAEFGVTFRAKADGSLSKMLGVSSRITKAEAYNAGAERLQVAFRFNGQNGSTISGLGFELYQNTPNPFVSKTQIGFYLPTAGEATLSIFDESGRMLFTQKGDFTNGYNAVTIDRSVLNTTGVLYYKLETATDSATRKMIQSK